MSTQAAIAWEHGGLARVIADRINDWNVIERAILTWWLHTLRDPRPHGGRAYLAWVHRHAPKRRRFDGPTWKQLAAQHTAEARAFNGLQRVPGPHQRWTKHDYRRAIAWIRRQSEGTGG